jgi:hypothetical protein
VNFNFTRSADKDNPVATASGTDLIRGRSPGVKRLLVLLFALILAGAAFANTGGSSQAKLLKAILTGTVYDPNHAVIAFGEVVAQSVEGKNYWAKTNDEGIYKFYLPPGNYRVEANAPGFCPKRLDEFKILSASPTCSHCNAAAGSLDFVLEISEGATLDFETRPKPCAQKTMIRKAQPGKSDQLKRIAE